MYRKKHTPNTPMLIAALALGVGYIAAVGGGRSITGSVRLDGIVGIVTGLFMCSHPAANLLNLLLFHQGAAYLKLSGRGCALFWALNAAVLLAGWWVIFSGALHFLMRG
jgi:hypothetical protein